MQLCIIKSDETRLKYEGVALDAVVVFPLYLFFFFMARDEFKKLHSREIEWCVSTVKVWKRLEKKK